MSSRTQPRPTTPATPGQPPDAQLTRAGRASQALTGRGSGATPRRLRLARLVHVLLAILLGVGVVAVGLELEDREAAAGVHAAQYKRAVSIEESLQAAQASAGGDPAAGAALPAETREEINNVTTTLLEMAESGTGEVDVLAAIGHDVSRYTEALAAGKQAQAGTLLTDDLLPAVKQLQALHNAESSTAVAWWMWLAPVGGWLALAAIAGISWFTARVSHRIVNPGLLIAAAATLTLATTSGSMVAAHAAGAARDFAPVVIGVVSAAVSAVAGSWGLHQRLKEYR